MAKPKETVKVLTGVGEETVDISPQYVDNIITIVGLSTGTVTIRAMMYNNTVLEEVVNGTLYLPNNRTKSIENYQLKQLGFTVSPEAAYTVKIRQYKPVDER